MENVFSQENLRSRRTELAVSISAKLFLERGIEAVKMTDIADASGIGVATLYRYFGTKTGITIEAMTYLWNQLKLMFSGIFESEVFLQQTGLKQLTDLMRMFTVLYDAHKDFMRLLSEFDLMLVREQVPKEALVNYERSIINFYPIFAKAYRTGIADGTVREVVDCQLFYVTFAHALLELCKKMVGGELLPSDHFEHATDEMNLLIDTAVCFLRKD
ncbi:MAG: TetR/AcrR family transcriptional regulator [Oscillospiraceae bacterium]|nr:TetR/AcrR family transcriptional regulator [Oscillospiraceae bacterium]